ncbi:hypothetical protein QWT87_20030 [Chryseobacterium sp. APV1]|uniref:Uncharacterized protein n=1 Tax=Chryseobacterium urinae TaxID=3058400 RepID=A0ABT8U7W8_9FLAO|nr:hypothetical protein [Chryseobacterium sp. APV1]MDO3427172.1 hypothetical protein [Chryseobacterium sp. APV1]
MILEVIHYYSALGNVGFGENLKKNIFTIITTSTLKSYINEILEDANKIFHDWINCEILAPGYLIPGNTKVDGYFSIKIKNGCVEDVKFKTILEEYNQNILW